MQTTTNTYELSVTLRGASIEDLITQAERFAEAGSVAVETTPPVKRGRKPKSALVDEELIASGDVETANVDDAMELADDTETLFDGVDEVEDAPRKTGKVKITDKDVNAAAMAHARKHGRPVTLKLLDKKFKVKSILELKPDQYPAVIAALKV